MTSFIDKFKGADRALVDLIREHKDTLRDGRILVIDPSSLSMGYALIDKMVITENGVVKLPQKMNVAKRLALVVETIQKRWPNVDALGIEKIRGGRAHIYLLWSAGAAVAGAGAPVIFEISVSSWNKMRGEEYEKSDEADARAMAEFVLGCLSE